MRVIQLTILLSAVFVARCIPLASQQKQVHEPSAGSDELTDDQVREKLAGITDVSPDKLEEVHDLNDVDSEVRTGEDEIQDRFWFWDTPKIKKPVKVITGAEALLHKPVIHNAEEKPGIIKPIIDKIKRPIDAVIDKTSEVANHLLEKPHKVLQKLGLEKPSVPIKPVHHLEAIEEYNHGFDIIDIKKPIEHLLNKPAINEWASHEDFNQNYDSIEDHEFVQKPIGIASVVDHESSHIPDKTSVLDHIKRPIQNLLNKPAEIAASIFHKPKPALDVPHTVDNKPVDVILNKPVEIASHIIDKPSFHADKPGIIGHIKEPSHAILNKPAEIVSDIFNGPRPDSHIIHFPTEDLDHSIESHDSIISITPSHKPTFSHNKHTSFYAGVHNFRPDMGFVDYGFLEPDQNPQTSNRPTQDWEPFWDSSYPLSFSEPSIYFSKKPEKKIELPHSAHYGITGGLNLRDFDEEGEDQEFERFISMVPYREHGGLFYL